MDYQKDYVQKLNFKEYEKTNVLAYELIMRNENCQKCFKKLHRVITKIDEIEQKNKQLIDIYDESKELRNYIENRRIKDHDLWKYSKLQNDFLEQMLNYFLILKGSYEEGEHAEYFKNYIEKKHIELLSNKYMNYREVIDSIQSLRQFLTEEAYKKGPNFSRAEINFEIKSIFGILIQSIGNKILSRKYDYIVGFITSDEKKEIAKSFQNFLDELLAAIGVASYTGVDKLSREIKYLINEEMEPHYIKYKKYERDITRIDKLRHSIEEHMSYEFYLDFQQELYLDYYFFSSKLQKDFKDFYKKLQQKKYSELEIPHHANMRTKEMVIENNISLTLETFFSIDEKLMSKINSIYLLENMIQMIKKNPNESIFRATFVKPNYARPSLFSERFRDITLTFNPNLSEAELLAQFKKIINLYQTNKLKNKSIYETLGEEFGKWSKKIKRQKRNYGTSKSTDKKDGATKDTLTLLNNIDILLYTYDADKKGVSHTLKTYPTNMSEASISSYLNMAKFLIDEQGYKILLTSHK